MKEFLPIIIMLNNYLHDLATALLFTSGFVLMCLYKWIINKDSKPYLDIYVKLFHVLTKLGLASLVWIFLGGIPRVIFFSKYEWWNAVSKGIILALTIKHIIMFLLVGTGIYLWIRLRKQLQKI